MRKITKDNRSAIGKVLIRYVLAFLIPFGIGIALFSAKEIAPFGEHSLFCMDLWGQYFPMYVQQAKPDSLGELFYSWNGAFGYNNWSQSAYYSNSIFWLLLKLLPVESMVNAVDWICLIKIALSSVTCLAFLEYKLQKKSPILIAGAISYSLCSYVLAFISQCMWTDSLIYVPVVLIGLEWLMQKKNPLLYTLMLALTIISSFYIGFAVCIFLVLYFVCNNLQQLHLERGSTKKLRLTGGKTFGLTVLRFALYSILAGAIAAAVILPTAMTISHTLASEMDAPEKLEWYNNITAYLQAMLPEQPLSLAYGVPNIATGILVFLMIPVYFCNKDVRISERIANGIFLVILFLSMNCNWLNYIWHGFHFPNQLPGRWTFLFSLLAVLLCSSGLARLSGLTPIRSGIGLALGFGAVVVTCKGLGEQDSVQLKPLYWGILVVAALLIFAASFAVWYCRRTASQMVAQAAEADTDAPQKVEQHGNRIRQMRLVSVGCIAALGLLQVYDIGSNFLTVSQLETGGLGTSDETSYSISVEKLHRYGKEWKSGKDEFYRVEANPGFTFNPSMLGDYRGMGYYSSTMQGSVYSLLQYMGNRVYAQNVSSVYNIGSPVQNSLFSMRYFLDVGHTLTEKVPGAVQVETNEECDIWENPTVLPIAYAVSDDLLTWEITDEVRAIQNQNNLLNKMCGRDMGVFQQMTCGEFFYENATLQESSNWNQNYFITAQGATEVKFHYVYTCEEDGPVYLEHNFRAGKIDVTYDGGSMQVDSGSEKFRYLGTFQAGSTITLEAKVENVQIGCCGLNLYHMNADAWNEAYEQLSAQAMDLEEFNTTGLQGKITLEQDSLVFTSIAQDGGWNVLCDGEEADVVSIGDALIGIRVPAGTHTLSFRYHVPGLVPGLLVSLAALLVTIWLCCPVLRGRILRKKTKQTFAEAASEKTAEEDASETESALEEKSDAEEASEDT